MNTLNALDLFGKRAKIFMNKDKEVFTNNNKDAA